MKFKYLPKIIIDKKHGWHREQYAKRHPNYVYACRTLTPTTKHPSGFKIGNTINHYEVFKPSLTRHHRDRQMLVEHYPNDLCFKPIDRSTRYQPQAFIEKTLTSAMDRFNKIINDVAP